MFGDNRNARDWAIEDMTTDGNRMIDRKYRIVREGQETPPGRQVG
jgi:hypothetical protein